MNLVLSLSVTIYTSHFELLVIDTVLVAFIGVRSCFVIIVIECFRSVRSMCTTHVSLRRKRTCNYMIRICPNVCMGIHRNNICMHLCRLLDIDPRTRITASDALQHPFFSEVPQA